MFVPFGVSNVYMENHMSINYYSHCLLILKLLPLMGQHGRTRICMVSSGAHHASFGLRLHDLNSAKLYSVYHSYSQSKLAQIMFTYHFDRWLKSLNADDQNRITINCLHPGICRTALMGGYYFFRLKFIQNLPLFRVSLTDLINLIQLL